MILECFCALNPNSHIESNVECNAQDPVTDPHSALRRTREGVAFVQAAGALGQNSEPCDEDLVECHGGTRCVGEGGDVGKDRTREGIVHSAEERAGDRGQIEGGEPFVRHLERCQIVQSMLDRILRCDYNLLLRVDRRSNRACTRTVRKETGMQSWDEKDQLYLPFQSARAQAWSRM